MYIGAGREIAQSCVQLSPREMHKIAQNHGFPKEAYRPTMVKNRYQFSTPASSFLAPKYGSCREFSQENVN
eukprot:14214325-Ditylum_brightwellii.AAC.1